jgi:hypothetical protein
MLSIRYNKEWQQQQKKQHQEEQQKLVTTTALHSSNSNIHMHIINKKQNNQNSCAYV